MKAKEVDQEGNELETAMRAREIAVFETFIDRALSIVRDEDNVKSITDACRLVDAALKAGRGDPSPLNLATATDNGVRSLIEELHTGYGHLRAAQAPGEAGVEERAL